MRAKRGFLYVIEWWLRLPWPPPLRRWWMQRAGVVVGAGARIHRCHLINVEGTGFRGLTVGTDAHVGPECLLDLASAIVIGDRATLAPRVTVLTHSDPGASAVAAQHPRREGPVSIGPDAWIGAGAVVMPGVSIGALSVVGAGSVVTRSVEAGTTVVGVPARPVP